jgi:8-oxo-dGTP pyrophosphatase MutT (NUDIX family)
MSWKKLSSELIYQTPFFNFRRDKCELADGCIMPSYYVFDFPKWVQVVALNEKKELILVNQYRYAGDKQFLEFPGGTTDPKSNEDSLIGAQRELKEETGYVSSSWQRLGSFFANPALQTNEVDVYLALNCKKVAELELDPFEEISVETWPVDKFIKHCRKLNHPHHGLMLASLFLALPEIES